MGIKRYIIASFVLLGIIAGYIYFGITTNSYKLQILEDLFGYSTALPIVFWMMLPTVILLIVTLVHLFYYGLKNYMINRAYLTEFIIKTDKDFISGFVCTIYLSQSINFFIK